MLDGHGAGARVTAPQLRLQLWAEHLGLAPEDPQLLTGDLLALWTTRAAALDHWHTAGGHGPRPPGQARRHDPAPVSRGQRLLAGRRITTVIPQPSDQLSHRHARGSAGGRPPNFDATCDRDRNVVERSYALMKQWRGLATRYDELAVIYRAAAALHAVISWCRHIGDTA